MKSKAFTIIEMVVTIGLVGFLLVILSSVLTNGLKSYRFGQKEIGNNEVAVRAVSDFEKITRGATSLVTAEADNLTFYSYLREDSHPAPSKIGYYLDGTTLYRFTIAPVQVQNNFTYPEGDKVVKKLADNVVNTDIFSYDNATNAELSFPVQLDVVRLVQMKVLIDDDQNSPPDPAEQVTSVQLRNLKTNL